MQRTSLRMGLQRTSVWLLLGSVILYSCGGGGDGGSGGPTAPNPSVNVQGSWSGTSTATVTQGPSCFGRNPVTAPIAASITQAGSSISLSMTLSPGVTCSYQGSVSDTSIRWTQDAQQANQACLQARGIPCLSGSSVRLVDTRFRTDSGQLSGTASSDRISVSGETVSDVLDSRTGQIIDTLRANIRVELQRQR